MTNGMQFLRYRHGIGRLSITCFLMAFPPLKCIAVVEEASGGDLNTRIDGRMADPWQISEGAAMTHHS